MEGDFLQAYLQSQRSTKQLIFTVFHLINFCWTRFYDVTVRLQFPIPRVQCLSSLHPSCNNKRRFADLVTLPEMLPAKLWQFNDLSWLGCKIVKNMFLKIMIYSDEFKRSGHKLQSKPGYWLMYANPALHMYNIVRVLCYIISFYIVLYCVILYHLILHYSNVSCTVYMYIK